MRKPDGSVKLLVYRKSTHTDQYLNFHSHHPIHHKLGLVRPLMDRCESLVTEDQDKVNEKKHIQQALTKCGYPKWTIDEVKRSMKNKMTKTTKRDKNKERSRGLVVIPYFQGVSESIERSFRKHKVAVSVKPPRTLRSMLVHPKDKNKETEKCEVVYEIGCLNCEDLYIGETGRKFDIQLKEHMKDVTNYTSSERKSSLTTFNKSTITDHVIQNNYINHIID